MDDATLLRSMRRLSEAAAWEDFEDALRGILADHENLTRDASGADTYAQRRRTVDKIEALYLARFAPTGADS